MPPFTIFDLIPQLISIIKQLRYKKRMVIWFFFPKYLHFSYTFSFSLVVEGWLVEPESSFLLLSLSLTHFFFCFCSQFQVQILFSFSHMIHFPHNIHYLRKTKINGQCLFVKYIIVFPFKVAFVASYVVLLFMRGTSRHAIETVTKRQHQNAKVLLMLIMFL